MSMKARIIITMCTIITLILGPSLSAQEERIPTVEEIFLLEPALLAIREQAASPDRDIKLLALDGIEGLIEENTFGENAIELMRILEELSSEGTTKEVREGNRLVNNFPMVRLRAAEILGQVGETAADDEIAKRASSALAEILRTDDEVMVKAEAAYALGVVGLDEGGTTVAVLAKAIVTQSTVAPDNNFAYAVVLAFEKIAEKNNGIRSFQAYTALVTVMQSSYTRKVREKAFEVLQQLRKY
jgi:hypothetical protein